MVCKLYLNKTDQIVKGQGNPVHCEKRGFFAQSHGQHCTRQKTKPLCFRRWRPSGREWDEADGASGKRPAGSRRVRGEPLSGMLQR